MRAALLLAVALAAGAPRVASAAPVEVGVASSLDKLRPDDRAPRARSVDLVAARGECESAQVAVRSGRPLAALGATASALRGGGAAIDVALYRVATVPLARPSGPDGAA